MELKELCQFSCAISRLGPREGPVLAAGRPAGPLVAPAAKIEFYQKLKPARTRSARVGGAEINQFQSTGRGPNPIARFARRRRGSHERRAAKKKRQPKQREARDDAAFWAQLFELPSAPATRPAAKTNANSPARPCNKPPAPAPALFVCGPLSFRPFERSRGGPISRAGSPGANWSAPAPGRRATD